MRIGIICEGTTDFEVFQRLAVDLGHADECVLIHPDSDALGAGDFSGGTGWQSVRKRLQSGDIDLSLGIYDAFVLHIDASVRHSSQVHLRTVENGESDLQPLCDEVKSWAKSGTPDNAIVALPREETEAWLLAGVPTLANLYDAEDVEAIERPAEVLVKLGYLGGKKGTVYKDPTRYRELTEAVVSIARKPKELARLPELERFLSKLRHRAKKVKIARRRG